jgi:hypothetical protein
MEPSRLKVARMHWVGANSNEWTMLRVYYTRDNEDDSPQRLGLLVQVLDKYFCVVLDENDNKFYTVSLYNLRKV